MKETKQISNKGQYKEMAKSQRGITLVALVITIIILIILATVAINFAFGNNGLITQAEKARDMAANSTVEEETAMNSMIAEIDSINGDTIAENSLVKAFERGEISVGDYVNYTPEAHDPVTVGTSETGYTNSESISDGTDQTFSQDASTTWRVLGLSEDGQHLLLTSGSPIKKDGDDPYLVLESYIGADNCVNVLNKICGLYHNSTLADETRSMTIKDIENVLGGVTVNYEEGTVTLNADSSNTDISDGFVSYPSYTYSNTDWTLTNPPVRATAGTTVNGNAYGFMYTFGDYGYEVLQALGVDIDERTYDMLFAGTTEDANYAKSYWLASPGVYAYSDYACFGPGAVFDGSAASGYSSLFPSAGGWRLAAGMRLAVRFVP